MKTLDEFFDESGEEIEGAAEEEKEEKKELYGYELPEDWDVVELKAVARRLRQSINPQKYSDELFELYSIPAYQYGEPEIKRGRDIKSQKLLIMDKIVLFGKINPRVPKIWYVNSNSNLKKICSTEFIPLEALESIEPLFLYYLCWSDFILIKAQSLVSGSTPSRQRVDIKAFLNLKIPLPPLEEQKKIAYVLRTIQRAIEQQDKIIETTKELKRSLMHRLFTRGLDASQPTKQTEIGEVPEHWGIVKVGDVFDVQQGKQLSKNKPPKEFYKLCPFLRTSNIEWGRVVFTHFDKMPISKKDLEKLKVKKGDIFVCEGGDVGRTGMLTEDIDFDLIYQNHLHRLRPKTDNIYPEFFVYWMENAILLRGKYVSSANRTTIPNLSASRLKGFSIPLPPSIGEQKQIAQILQTVDRKIEIAKRKKEALQDLFKTMLHKLMTAQIRVKELEIPAEKLSSQLE